MTNRQHFRDLSWLTAHWELSDDGVTVASGRLTLPAVGPGATVQAELDGWPATVAPAQGERWLSFHVETAADLPWAPAGFEVCWDQVKLSKPVGLDVAQPSSDGSVPLDAEGRLVHPLLAAAPTLSLWRAPTDNDRISGLAQRWLDAGLRTPQVGLAQVDVLDGHTRVRRDIAVGAAMVHHEQVFSLLPGGGIHVRETVTVPPTLDDLPRIGTVLELATGLEQLEWFGGGPHESYPDRKRAAQVGRWRSNVTDQFVPYVRPQEAGGRADVRWLELRDEQGSGVRLSMDAPLQVSVIHYRESDLADTSHAVDLVPRPEVVVHLDVAHRGLGTASCGPDTVARYLVGPGVYRWGWSISSLG